MYRSTIPAVCALISLSVVPATYATIDEIPPFQGALSENFDGLGSHIVSEQPVFGGVGIVRGVSGLTSVHVLFGDQFHGKQVWPRSAPLMLGVTEPAVWTFNTPVTQWGGYFQNNSGADDATAAFYDSAGQQIGSATVHVPFASPSWVWNGWSSDVPFSRVQITGNGTLGGWIWYDDMQLTLIPEPGALLMLAVGAALATRRVLRRSAT